MRKLLLLIIPAFFLMASQCEDDSPAAQMTLNFKATYAGDPLVLFANTYAYPTDNEVKFQLFQFYISDVTLLKNESDADGVLLSEIELVKFKDQMTADAAGEGVSFSFDNLPAGDYRAIRFGLGVAPRLNAKAPGDFASDAPLSDNYWSAAASYVFAKIEGKADVSNSGEFNTGLTYHIGGDPLYRVRTFPINASLTDFGDTDVTFTVDLKNVMVSNGTYLDIDQPALTIDHTNNPVIYEMLWNNLNTAVGPR